MRNLLNLVPEPVRVLIRKIKRFLEKLPYYGKGRWCPVCETHSRKFREYGAKRRKDAQCVYCGALERHRFVWLYFNKMTDLFDGKVKTMLHIAPERCFETRLKEHLGKGYITADLLDPHAMVRMDVVDIQYPNNYFDVIYCSHVLEHVQDDKKAMSEFYRILRKGGWAILLVPITAEKTIEDPSILDPNERLRLFGQKDHVRRYGPDYIDRLSNAGFHVQLTRVSDLVEKDMTVRMGLTAASGDIYFCSK